MLAPVSPETFFAEYWGQRPLFIKGSPAKLRRMISGGFSEADFIRGAHRAAEFKNPEFRLFCQKQPRGVAGEVFQIASLQPAQIEAMLADGANVGCENFCHEPLAAFAASVKTQLHLPAQTQVLATLSPAGNGWPLHVDAAGAFNIQCEGRKRFTVSAEPAVRWPRGSIIFSDETEVHTFLYDPEGWEFEQPVVRSELLEYELAPGDVLYWPAGTLHTTEALSDRTLNLAFTLAGGRPFDLLLRLFEKLLSANPNWRHLPLVNPLRVKRGELPPAAAAFFGERLNELRALLDRLSPGGDEFNREWQRVIAHPGPGVVPALLAAGVAPGGRALKAKDRLRLTRNAPVTYATGTAGDGEPCMTLYYLDREVEVDGEWVPFLQTLVEQDEFAAGDATRWAGRGRRYAWATVKEYLAALLEQGIVERVGTGPDAPKAGWASATSASS